MTAVTPFKVVPDAYLFDCLAKYCEYYGLNDAYLRDAIQANKTLLNCRVLFEPSSKLFVTEYSGFRPAVATDAGGVYVRLHRKNLRRFVQDTGTISIAGLEYHGQIFITVEERNRTLQDYLQVALEEVADPKLRNLLEFGQIALAKTFHGAWTPAPALNRSPFAKQLYNELALWNNQSFEFDLGLLVMNAPPRMSFKPTSIGYVDIDSELESSPAANWVSSRLRMKAVNVFFDLDSSTLPETLKRKSVSDISIYEESLRGFAATHRHPLLVFAGKYGASGLYTFGTMPFIDTMKESTIVRISDSENMFALGSTVFDLGKFGYHQGSNVPKALSALLAAKKSVLEYVERFFLQLPDSQRFLMDAQTRAKDLHAAKVREFKLEDKITAVKHALAAERLASEQRNGQENRGSDQTLGAVSNDAAATKRRREEPSYRAALAEIEIGDAAAKKLKAILPSGLPVPKSIATAVPSAATASASSPVATSGPAVPVAVTDQEIDSAPVAGLANKTFRTLIKNLVASEIENFDALTSKERESLLMQFAKRRMSRLDMCKMLKHFTEGRLSEDDIVTLSLDQLLAQARKLTCIQSSQVAFNDKAQRIFFLCCASTVSKAEVKDSSKAHAGTHCMHLKNVSRDCWRMESKTATLGNNSSGRVEKIKVYPAFDYLELPPELPGEIVESVLDWNAFHLFTKELLGEYLGPNNERGLFVLNEKQILSGFAGYLLQNPRNLHSAAIMERVASFDPQLLPDILHYVPFGNDNKQRKSMGQSFNEIVVNRVIEFASLLGYGVVRDSRPRTSVERVNSSHNTRPLGLVCFFREGMEPKNSKWVGLEKHHLFGYGKKMM